MCKNEEREKKERVVREWGKRKVWEGLWWKEKRMNEWRKRREKEGKREKKEKLKRIKERIREKEEKVWRWWDRERKDWGNERERPKIYLYWIDRKKIMMLIECVKRENIMGKWDY